MRHLIDAHSLIWAVDEPLKLASAALAAMQDPSNELVLSAGTIWELSIKVGLGKLSLSSPFRTWITKAIADLGLTILPITIEHAEVYSSLPFHHRDPFDRLLVAQIQVEGFLLVSSDSVFDLYRVRPCGQSHHNPCLCSRLWCKFPRIPAVEITRE
jgi:PIN domain nuclease of toxin-antitoxin system